MLHEPVTLIDQLIALIKAERKRSGGLDSFVNYASNERPEFWYSAQARGAGSGRPRNGLSMGFLLTNSEVAELYRTDRLTRWSIREHASAAGKGSRQGSCS
jgi:hypothetical protein